MLASLLLALASSMGMQSLPIRTTYIALPDRPSQRLALHCAYPAHVTHKSVLFVHGASFPTMLAAGFEFAPGDSWMAYTARQGYVACGLDFLGFGASSRPPAMNGSAHDAPPVTDAREAAREIALAVDDLHRRQGMASVHIVAHSWGTVPAATFAAAHAHALASLTLFGPIVPLAVAGSANTDHPAWWTITAQQRLEQLRFKDVLPPGKYLLEHAVDQRWAPAFAATVPHVKGDLPGILRIPNGPLADIDAVSAGSYPYDASNVIVPVFVVYGNYDHVVDDAGAARFLQKFTNSPLRWRLRIDDGTHVMHLETHRRSLYESVNAFIHAAEDQAP
jgi:pimeloyl-ACP methyl ester carboxylesterase